MRSSKYTKKLLFVSNKISDCPRGGRDLLSNFIRDALLSIYGNNLSSFELLVTPKSLLAKVANFFRGFNDGVDPIAINHIIQLVSEKKINQIFLNGSNLGGCVAALKKKFPDLEVIVFFHNVEARFFWGAFKASRSLHSFAVLVSNFIAERRAAKFSDKRICLCERDGALLKRIYGYSSSHISPIVVVERVASFDNVQFIPNNRNFAIFVGGNFYANRNGIAWFVKYVVPRIDIHLFVIGAGFEALRSELEIPGRVTVIGAVDDLSIWYRNAKFVVAPIFDGSGMKTKVAEALMFGKRIIGSNEAFTGYEDIISKAGWLCNDADEFVAAINGAFKNINIDFDEELRDIYIKNYSFCAGLERLRNILIPLDFPDQA